MGRRWIVLLVVIVGALIGLRPVHAQAGGRVFNETGQTLDNSYGFLQFWETHEGALLLGPPVTAVLEEANVPVQYFEYGRLERRTNGVVVGNVGRDYARWRSFAALPQQPLQPHERRLAGGYRVAGAFLEFWDRHDGATMLGLPLSDALWETIDGANIRVQYFERARLEQPDSGDPRIRIGALGRAVAVAKGLIDADLELAAAQPAVVDVDSPAAAFRSIPAPAGEPVTSVPAVVDVPPVATDAVVAAVPVPERLPAPPQDSNEIVVDLSGNNGDQVAHGPAANGPAAGGRAPAPVATARPATRAATPPLAPSVPAAAPTPQPTIRPTPQAPRPTVVPTVAKPTQSARPAAPSPTSQPKPAPRATGKVIEVNLTKQWMYVFQDGTEVYRAPVATGKDGFETPTGTYHIYNKLPLRTMRGTANGQSWVVPNVPNVLYVVGGVALHGTYWHNKFGTGVRMSHGCINLSLRDAAWLYQWAPVGTTVTIHY